MTKKEKAMRRVSVEELEPGMVLARPVYSPSGDPLINQGVELRENYIKKLQRMGQNGVYIEDERLEGVEVEEVVSEESKISAKRILNNVLKDESRQYFLEKTDKSLLQAVEKIIDEVLTKENVVVDLYDVKTSDSYTHDHSLSVSILSLITGKKMNLSHDELVELALGSLLHDVGIKEISTNILDKKEPLTKEELDIIKEHTLIGYNIFKGTHLFCEEAGSIILQHHERYQGHGYPFGLQENEINRFAQLVSIADVYDAATSTRPYRKAYKPHEAINMLKSLSGIDFNQELLNVFLDFVPAYPVGTHVILNNGESGLVIGNKAGETDRPKVRILYESENRIFMPHPQPYDIDLSLKPTIKVIGVR